MGQIYYKKLLINLYLVILERWKDAKFNASAGYSLVYDDCLEKNEFAVWQKTPVTVRGNYDYYDHFDKKRHTAGAMCLW